MKKLKKLLSGVLSIMIMSTETTQVLMEDSLTLK